MDKNKEIRREMHTAGADLHVRSAAEGEASGRTIEGYAILFDTPSAPFCMTETDEIREIIDAGAVTRELLDSSDIKFTLFHDRQLLLARSKNGKGTLSYDIDGKGVKFSFDAPATADGDKALELVRSGIIDGCSFAFSTLYFDDDHVEREVKKDGSRRLTTYRVKKITGIYDMTLTPDPAYPTTSVEARELAGILSDNPPEDESPNLREYVRQMRNKAGKRK